MEQNDIMMALCQDSDGDFDDNLFEQLSTPQPCQDQYSRINFFVPAEARELFSTQEIEQRQVIAQQWFSRNQQIVCS